MRSDPAGCSRGWSSVSRKAQAVCPSVRRRTLPPSRRHAHEGRAMMFDLTGKGALVTGASGGIGGAIARALPAQGATCAVSGPRRDALDALASELPSRVHVLTCDLADKDAVEALVPACEAAMGK